MSENYLGIELTLWKHTKHHLQVSAAAVFAASLLFAAPPALAVDDESVAEKNGEPLESTVWTTEDPAAAVTTLEGAAEDLESQSPQILSIDSFSAQCGSDAALLESATATYASLVDRLDEHGMAPTSLTDTYPAGLMYMRDAAAQALTMIKAGDVEEAGRLVRTLVTYPLAAGFTRDGSQTLPHRLPLIEDSLAQTITASDSVHTAASEEDILVAELNTADLGILKQTTRLDVPLRGSLGDVELEILVRPVDAEGAPDQVATASASLSPTSTSSVAFLLSPPGYPTDSAPSALRIAIYPAGTDRDRVEEALTRSTSNTETQPSTQADSSESVDVDGPDEATAGGDNEGEGLDTGVWTQSGDDALSVQSGQSELQQADTPEDAAVEPQNDNEVSEVADDSKIPHATQTADTTDTEHADSMTWMAGNGSTQPAFVSYSYSFPIADPMNGNDDAAANGARGSTWEETDEYYHVIYAWAEYVKAAGTGVGEEGYLFAQETWSAVSQYLQYHLERGEYWLNTLTASTTLMQNPRLDAVNYHDYVYDMVTNVFLAETYRDLAELSEDLGFVASGPASVSISWESLASKVDKGIEAQLIRKINGKTVYVPWINSERKAETSTSVWVPLIALSIDWSGLDATVMRNTLDLYSARNGFDFGGVRMLNARNGKGQTLNAGADGYTGQWVLLKSLSWELKFETQQGDAARADELMSWMRAYFPSTSEPAPESWIVNNPRQIPVRDGGNQEHSAWFVSAFLDLYPQCAQSVSDSAAGYDAPPKKSEYTPIGSKRYAGATRLETAAQAAVSVYAGEDVRSVYLARSDVYADALSAGTLQDGPILLMNSDGSLPDATAAALRELQPSRVVALGGTSVIPSRFLSAAADAAGTRSTARLSGTDRFGTSAQVALEALKQDAAEKRTVVYLADGLGPDAMGSPDAVSAGGLTNGYLLLINSNSKTLPKDIASALKQINPTKVVALGGTAVVSNEILALAQKVSGAESSGRAAGSDRYGTSIAIYRLAAEFHTREVVLARGDVLIDAITAGGLNRGPVLLTRTDAATSELIYEIQRTRPWMIRVLGGDQVVRDKVVNTLALAAVTTS